MWESRCQGWHLSSYNIFFVKRVLLIYPGSLLLSLLLIHLLFLCFQFEYNSNPYNVISPADTTGYQSTGYPLVRGDTWQLFTRYCLMFIFWWSEWLTRRQRRMSYLKPHDYSSIDQRYNCTNCYLCIIVKHSIRLNFQKEKTRCMFSRIEEIVQRTNTVYGTDYSCTPDES